MSTRPVGPPPASTWQFAWVDVLALAALVSKNVSVQPRYKYDPRAGQWRWLDPDLVKRWLQEKLFDLLLGTLVPDIVIHASGNPNEVQRVYDFKFPCLPEKKGQPKWRDYAKGQPHYPKNQGRMYKEALGDKSEPALVTPQLGVQR